MAEEDQLFCLRCERRFPVLLGMPLITARPSEWLNRWRGGLGRFVEQLASTEKQLLIEFMDEALGQRARGRLKQVVSGLGLHREEVVELLAQIGVAPEALPAPEANADAQFSPETYFTLIHRDYGWAPEVDEVQVSWERLLAVLPQGFELGKTLVLGAGTGRLAWQLATELGKGSPVVAIDNNPLPFVVSALLLAGRPVTLTELPAHPRRSKAVTATRALACPCPTTTALSFVLADGLDPPVVRGKFDTVVMPWFVDQVPKDAARMPELANALLCEGGNFLVTGPFLYDTGRTKPALRYCADEFVEFVEKSGFCVTGASYLPEPYVASPLSTQGRIEHVLYMHAQKTASRTISEVPAYLTASGSDRPVPKAPGVDQASFPLDAVAAVAALIDGQRSVDQIARILIDRGVLGDDGSAAAAVRGCLKMIFKQCPLPPS